MRAPYTGAEIGTIPAGTVADLEFAVERARAAQTAWSKRTFSDRAGIFLRFHDLLLERQDEVLDLIQWETGKARRHAFEEILDTTIVTRYYARRAERLLRPRRRKGALPLLTRTRELKSPVGVVGFIVPWNYPLNLAVTDAVPALMAGNAAVLKPDVQTSFTALWAVDLLRQAGLPPDVFGVVTGEGPLLGPALVERADYVMFTGSTRTGRLVARQAAERLIGCSLELGGKNPMIVLADADVEAAVYGAIQGCFASAGQVCVSIERIYVHESIAERFLGRLAERTRALKVGASLDYSMEMGSLTGERQLQHVEEHVRDAVEKGAVVVAGGRRRPDHGPAVLRAHDPDQGHGKDAGVCRGDFRSGGGGLSVCQRERSGGARQCHALRFERERVDARCGPRREAGARDPRGQRQRERIVRGGVGVRGCAVRRAEGIRDARASRGGRHFEIHGDADGGGAKSDAGRNSAVDGGRAARALDDAFDETDESD